MQKKTINDKVKALFDESFSKYDIEDVPDIEDSRLTHGNTGFKGEFAFLYVDMRGSSTFTGTHRLQTIAKIYKAFHYCMVECIKEKDGKIRSFDGDRVLGVFAGKRKVNKAVECAKQMIGCLIDVLQPKINSYFKNDNFEIGIGISVGETLVVKAGVGYDKNNRDLVWIGDAPNLGAKLSDNSDANIGRIKICSVCFARLNDSNRWNEDENGKKDDMWDHSQMEFAGSNIDTYDSGWYYSLS